MADKPEVDNLKATLMATLMVNDPTRDIDAAEILANEIIARCTTTTVTEPSPTPA